MNLVVNPENEWRVQTPGSKVTQGWKRSAHPGAARKYLMISTDTHLNPPPPVFVERIESQYKDRVPRIRVDEAGNKWMHSEANRPYRIFEPVMEGEDLYRQKAGLVVGEEDVQRRLADQDLDGIEGEVMFPGGAGLLAYATNDASFAQAMCRVYNDWAWEIVGKHKARMKPAACIATADVDGAVAEAARTARKGFEVLSLPCKPIWGAHEVDHINYNLPVYDPLWALIQDLDLPITFHIATGRDPRAARGNGGAVINYACHAISPAIEPVTSMCASGVFERFPKLRFAVVEAGIGWVPWLMDAMDEAYLKHHFWVKPKLKHLPSEYFRRHGAATFQEDPSGLALVERYRLENNFMWANDYPHHEGTFPHSAAAIERLMGGVSEDTRARILGLNGAKFFGFDIPAKFRD